MEENDIENTTVPRSRSGSKKAGSNRLLLSISIVLLVAFGIGSIAVDIFAFTAIAQPTSINPIYEDLKTQLLLSIIKVHGLLFSLVLLFFFIFRLIFGYTPFVGAYGDSTRAASGVAGEHERERILPEDPRALMASFSAETAAIAREIFVRSGVYLYVGVLIASVGVIFFAWRSFGTNGVFQGKEFADFLSYLVPLLPSAGVLFFIEFVAFFFLRQARATMDEFRYFDAVRRSREESLVILEMFAENPTVVSTSEVLRAMNLYSATKSLGRDETTELLEMRKLQRDELAVFEKIIEAVETLRQSKEDSDPKKRPEK